MTNITNLAEFRRKKEERQYTRPVKVTVNREVVDDTASLLSAEERNKRNEERIKRERAEANRRVLRFYHIKD